MKTYGKLLSLLLAAVLLLSCGAAAEEPSALWRVGFGCVEFLPADYDPETDSFGSDYYIAGYNNDHTAVGVLDPQTVRAAYLSDGETAIVVAAVDCVGLSAASIENIRERIQPLVEEYGLADVHIASTHTHAGIDTLGLWGPVAVDGKNDAFMEILYDAAAEAVRMACGSAREGRLYFGSAPGIEGFQRDSRLPEIFDSSIYRLRFEPSDGSAGLQIVSYDAHAEALRSENRMVSADYPYYMGRRIYERTGDEFMYFAGAVGGLIMTHVQTSPYERNVAVTGEMLADALLDGVTERELPAEIAHATRTIRIDLENKAFVMMAFLGVLDTRPVEGGGSYGMALETRVSLLRLGGADGVNIAMVPGEYFPELAMGGSCAQPANPEAENPTPLRELVDGKLIVWGLCDDEIGYIVTPDDFFLHPDNPYFENAYDSLERKHYEETNSVGPAAAYVISDAFGEMTAELAE